jgi:eukaryotic-like serine/threonine-protein kinase
VPGDHSEKHQMTYCPDQKLLEQLVNNRLAGTELEAELDRHVAVCASCQQAIKELIDHAVGESLSPPGITLSATDSASERVTEPPDFSAGPIAAAIEGISPGLPEVPGYEVTGEIASGGMGAVLKGHDHDLGRDVALKVLRDDYRDDSDMIHRFVEEAQIGGQLQHPGVVPIYELGTLNDRRPFFAMKLVKGHTLARLLDAREGPDDDRPRFLSIFEAVCQTAAYAHARSVIHRDLKPSNVMVGAFGEVQVMDWGLAKVLTQPRAEEDQTGPRHTLVATARTGSDTPDLSRPGSAMGTPGYMAPEQARGEHDRVDSRADVFALGSILCEILTGHPAFRGKSASDIVRKTALGDTQDALARLTEGEGQIELIALARDCLAREPEDRPRNAAKWPRG